MNREISTKYLDHLHLNMISKGWTNGNKIMIVMHGLGDSLDSYVEVTKEINVTGLHYLLVNAPRPYFFGHSWYDMPPNEPHPGIVESVSIINKVIEELYTQGFQSQDIFLMGFSQGGCIALETFYTLKKPLGGIIALSPRIYEQRIPSQLSDEQKATPIFCAHGHHDQAIPFTQTKQRFQNIAKLHPQTVFNEYEMEHTIDYYEIMDLREWLNNYL